MYIKTYLCQRKNNGNGFLVSQEDPYLRFLKILNRCDKSRKYNILGPFLDLKHKTNLSIFH